MDAAKSSIVYGVAKAVSTPGRAVRLDLSKSSWILTVIQAIVSFSNQALKNMPQSYQIDLLEKYKDITRDDVLRALRQYFLPLFNSSTSVAVVVTAPGKAAETGERLSIAGFEVTQRELEIDPSEMEDSEWTESGSESESDDERR